MLYATSILTMACHCNKFAITEADTLLPKNFTYYFVKYFHSYYSGIFPIKAVIKSADLSFLITLQKLFNPLAAKALCRKHTVGGF